MKKRKKITIVAALAVALYCIAYLAYRHYGIRHCSDYALSQAEVDSMTDAEYEALVLDYWARKPVPYSSGIVGGVLYWSFLPLRILDKLITGRESEYGGLFTKRYEIPRAGS